MGIEVTSNDASVEAAPAAAGKSAPEESKEQKSASDLAGAESDESTEESETSETEAEEGSDDSQESEDEEGSKEESKESDKKPKKKSGFQRRIEKLNKRISDKDREVEYWKSEALKGHQRKEDPAPAKEAAEITGKPKPGDFETNEEYVEALTDWKIEQRELMQRESQLKSKTQDQVTSFQSKVQSFKESCEDFDDVLEGVDDVPMSVAVQEILLESENGPELMYELAKNREEYERICKLPPLAAAREMGKFEAKLKKSSAENQVTEVKKTKAPPPINPVGSGSATVKKSIYDPNLSQHEYERLRREQMRRPA